MTRNEHTVIFTTAFNWNEKLRDAIEPIYNKNGKVPVFLADILSILFSLKRKKNASYQK